jgi:serine/threonine protein kinase
MSTRERTTVIIPTTTPTRVADKDITAALPSAPEEQQLPRDQRATVPVDIIGHGHVGFHDAPPGPGPLHDRATHVDIEHGRELGKGSFGTVFEGAVQLKGEKGKRPCVVKVLKGDVNERDNVFCSPHVDAHGCAVINSLIDIVHESPKPPCAFVRTLATGIMHLSVTGDAQDSRDHLVIIQEKASGIPLSSYVFPCQAKMTKDQVQIGHSAAYRLMADVAETVGWMHAHDVAHGDLKPGNLIVKKVKGHHKATIIDYTTVEFLEPGTKRAQVGTPAYRPMARSQQGVCTPQETDQFAVAIMVLEAATNHYAGGLDTNHTLAIEDANRLPAILQEPTKALLRGRGNLPAYAQALRLVASAARTVEMDMHLAEA